MRRHLAVGLLLSCTAFLPAAAAQAQPNDPRMPQTPEERKFYSVVSLAIYQVMPQEKERFTLTLADRTNPIFSAGANGFEQVPCEKLAAFHFIGHGNELGGITAAVCKNGSRVRELSVRSRASVAADVKTLGASDEDARKIGWYYAVEALGDGSEFYYFPVFAFGHGVLSAYTGALYHRKSGMAVVVQASPYPMCEHLRQYYDASPFCADIRQTLKRVARTLQGAM
jgi:hypothetical protein